MFMRYILEESARQLEGVDQGRLQAAITSIQWAGGRKDSPCYEGEARRALEAAGLGSVSDPLFVKYRAIFQTVLDQTE